MACQANKKRLAHIEDLARLLPETTEGRERLLQELAELRAAMGDDRPGSSALYELWGPRAKRIKVAAQMIVGTVGGVAAVVIPVVSGVLGHGYRVQMVLDVVAFTLALAAAIELAYTLFTDGPDEAIDPAALGLSSAIIFQLGSVSDFTVTQAGAAVLYALALGALLYFRRRLVNVVER